MSKNSIIQPQKTSLRLHPTQYDVFSDPARFKVMVASRRWGKSRLILTTVVTKAINFIDITGIRPCRDATAMVFKIV